MLYEDAILAGRELTIAHEGVDGSIGAGNALMLASPNSSILAKW